MRPPISEMKIDYTFDSGCPKISPQLRWHRIMPDQVDKTKREPVKLFHSTKRGEIYFGDSLDLLTNRLKPASVDLIMTSPPFGLVRRRIMETLPRIKCGVVQAFWRSVTERFSRNRYPDGVECRINPALKSALHARDRPGRSAFAKLRREKTSKFGFLVAS